HSQRIHFSHPPKFKYTHLFRPQETPLLFRIPTPLSGRSDYCIQVLCCIVGKIMVNFIIPFGYGTHICSLAVRIEPHLFEWLGWYSGKLPNFLSPTTLNELGYNVDREYQSLSSLDQLDLQESVPQFYARSTQLVNDILEHNPTKGR
ncbi:unnamed protein product, partial [Hydatigera taeniaeformis]|uniref:Cytochrome P450 n=1 Tax=Hydatigena taeniaeformis TaxID=6205 RepID=A0A0R3XCT1_HYDTA